MQRRHLCRRLADWFLGHAHQAISHDRPCKRLHHATCTLGGLEGPGGHLWWLQYLGKSFDSLASALLVWHLLIMLARMYGVQRFERSAACSARRLQPLGRTDDTTSVSASPVSSPDRASITRQAYNLTSLTSCAHCRYLQTPLKMGGGGKGGVTSAWDCSRLA